MSPSPLSCFYPLSLPSDCSSGEWHLLGPAARPLGAGGAMGQREVQGWAGALSAAVDRTRLGDSWWQGCWLLWSACFLAFNSVSLHGTFKDRSWLGRVKTTKLKSLWSTVKRSAGCWWLGASCRNGHWSQYCLLSLLLSWTGCWNLLVLWLYAPAPGVWLLGLWLAPCLCSQEWPLSPGRRKLWSLLWKGCT